MEWVDARLGESLARLTDCAPALAAKLRREAALGTEMGGLGVGGHAATCGACWCAFVLGRWDALRQACPLLRADEVGLAFGARPRQRHEAAGAPLDILLSARAEYAGLLDRLDAVQRQYAHRRAKDKIYYKISGGKFDGLFIPRGLPSALPSPTEALDTNSDIKPAKQRVLCAVVRHEAWLAALAACELEDEVHPHATCRDREQTRFIAISQPCAGGWLDIPPDGTWDATITTPAFVIGLQRRYGLPISSAAAAFDALEARGEPVDRLGDGLANAGSYNKRHNAVVSAVRRMVAACAVGPIVLGDKESPWKTASICDTHVPDVVELEADDTGTGGDTIYEIKVPTPLKKKHAAGVGSRAHGGCPATVGHLYGFGSTEEEYTLLVRGTSQRGRRAEGPFNHSTGKGYVEAKPGQYAGRQRGSHLIVFLVEAIARAGRAQCGLLTRRAKAKSARDRTTYGRARNSTRLFYLHHTRLIAKAAVVNDAMGIREQVQGLRQRVCAAHAAASGWP